MNTDEKKITLSVYNIVKNEEKQIAGYLSDLVDFADEIVVVDTGSSDKTLEIVDSFVKKYNNIKLYHYQAPGAFHYGQAWNFAIRNSTRGYLVLLATDERLAEDFKNNVRKFLVEKNPDVVKIKRVDESLPHLIDYPERIIRNNLGIYYRSDEGGRVHEQLVHDRKADVFEGIIWHQQRWNHYIYRPQRILFQLELQIERVPKTKSFLGHFLRGIWYFGYRFRKLYFRGKLYKDGKLGFKYAYMRALDAFLVEFFVGLKPNKYPEFWEQKQSRTADDKNV
ncbi:MAG: hypothetical protein C3F02_00300 [Parcubacteria group bacterium]|nr:MAG: hypothetical protein C3F02_00300 [Parcubacteria group bacterium]